MSQPALHEDFKDLMFALRDAGVRLVVVGAHAMAAHGVPRATGDLDILVAPEAANATRFVQALERFALGRRQLLANKLATGRPKDLVDAQLLEQTENG